MPWSLRVNPDEVADAIDGALSWREVLDALGYAYHGKNIATIRKWATRWGILTEHLTDLRGGKQRRVRYTEAELAEAVAASVSWAETLRRLGYCPTGGNWRTLKRRVQELGISAEHFDPYAASRAHNSTRRIPLEKILVQGSTYGRTNLKRRLYEAGLKERRCELCGQGEHWQGRRISLIIDHVNGVRDDHRLENLRIVCPNCAAALDTHCGRKTRIELEPRVCLRCEKRFVPNSWRQRYCSRACGTRWNRRGQSRGGSRKVERPPQAQLLREVRELGYVAVGRKYGVSDNAIRKWLRQYERQAAIESGHDPDLIEIPKRTWPNRRREQDGRERRAA